MEQNSQSPQCPQKLRIRKKHKFAVKDSELLNLTRQVFRNYCQSLDHTPQEMLLLTQLFNHYLHKDNIRNYLNLPAKLIYHGIINKNLYDYSQKIV